jgi:hypothetical protein
MASKMLAALDANNTRITISMAEQDKYQKPLKCEDEFCNATVEFVNGYSRIVGDSIVPVDPFFRRGKDCKHSESCQYNVYGQIAVIARQSEGDIFAALQHNRFELRLLAVTRDLEQLRELAMKKQGSCSKVASETTEKNYVEAEQRLGAYINSAQRVLKVRNACEEHSEIEDVLHLVFDGARLPWRNFYFEDADYFRCFSQVHKATVQVPIAIKGIVKETTVAKGKFAVINLVRPSHKTDLDVLDLACFSIWSPDLSAFESYKEGGEILAFGIWESRGIKESPNKSQDSPIKVFRNHELRLWPVTKSQIEYHRVSRKKKPSPKKIHINP